MERVLSIAAKPFLTVVRSVTWVINTIPFIFFIVVMFLAFPVFFLPVANPSNWTREYQTRDDGSVWSRRVWRTYCENTTKWLDLSKLVRYPDEGDLYWFVYRWSIMNIKNFMRRGLLLFKCDLWELLNTQIAWQEVGHEGRMREDWKEALEKMDDQISAESWKNLKDNVWAASGYILERMKSLYLWLTPPGPWGCLSIIVCGFIVVLLGMGREDF